MEKIRVAIVDEQDLDRQKLERIVNSDEEIIVVGTSQDGEKAFEMIQTTEPDVVLVDIVMSKLDAPSWVDKLNNSMEIGKRPAVIVLFSMEKERIAVDAFFKGATIFLMPPQDDLDLITRIKYMYNLRNNNLNMQGITLEESKKRNPEEAIKNIFREIDVPIHSKGYDYLKEAVLMAVEDAQVLDLVSETLYPSIAKLYQTSLNRVEEGIRNAIEITWLHGRSEEMKNILGFSIDGEKPTNIEFIARVADKIR
ncbi:MAG: sporulation initiation factor Spo0A C-terminal domain-containing protein [Lachnospiraceae bacterium]